MRNDKDFNFRSISKLSVFLVSSIFSFNFQLAKADLEPDGRLIELKSCGLISSSDSPKSLSASFTQTRTINGLQRPLVSDGSFQLSPGKEIVWETLNPIHSRVVVSKAGIELTSLQSDTPKTEIHSDSKFRELGNLLLSLHSLSESDTKSLSKRLQLLCFAYNDGHFRLNATAKSGSLKRVLEQVDIIGRDKPTKIIVSDARGDTTSITFTYPD